MASVTVGDAWPSISDTTFVGTPDASISDAAVWRVSWRRMRRRPLAFTLSGRLAVTLHTAIRDRHLSLPDDDALIDELANVRLRETSPGVLRIDHDPDKHDDRAIALALAVHRILDKPRGQGSAFMEAWRRELAAESPDVGGAIARDIRSQTTHREALERGHQIRQRLCHHYWFGTSCTRCGVLRGEVTPVQTK